MAHMSGRRGGTADPGIIMLQSVAPGQKGPLARGGPASETVASDAGFHREQSCLRPGAALVTAAFAATVLASATLGDAAAAAVAVATPTVELTHRNTGRDERQRGQRRPKHKTLHDTILLEKNETEFMTREHIASQSIPPHSVEDPHRAFAAIRRGMPRDADPFIRTGRQ